jgi:hypothetical protein
LQQSWAIGSRLRNATAPWTKHQPSTLLLNDVLPGTCD